MFSYLFPTNDASLIFPQTLIPAAPVHISIIFSHNGNSDSLGKAETFYYYFKNAYL